MRSSSARPVPRSSTTTPTSNRPIPLPRQNGGGAGSQQQQQNRQQNSSSRSSRTAASERTPSVPVTPRFINKRYAHVKSKVNSITDHSPAPSAVKIFHQPVKVNAGSRVGSLQNANHTPSGGNVKIENRKLNFRETAKPRVEAKSEVEIPKSQKKIPTQKLDWKAESKIGSLENAGHKPGGGQIKIFNEPVQVKVDSKVGSLDNIGHVPGGGNVKISDYSRSISGTGSVRSRRDTADSGSSRASTKERIELQQHMMRTNNNINVNGNGTPQPQQHSSSAMHHNDINGLEGSRNGGDAVEEHEAAPKAKKNITTTTPPDGGDTVTEGELISFA